MISIIPAISINIAETTEYISSNCDNIDSTLDDVTSLKAPPRNCREVARLTWWRDREIQQFQSQSPRGRSIYVLPLGGKRK